jgi:hypothetical protein
MRLPDPDRSSAVLIGIGYYRSPHLEDLPAVQNNLHDLSAVLTDPTLGAIRADRCVVVSDPPNGRTVYRHLRASALAADDTLLVYLACHARPGPRNELYLCLADTEPDELTVSGLPFDVIREVLGDSPARNRILILDCCFSGRVTADMSGPAGSALGQVAVAGTYTLASAPPNAPSLAPAGERHTAFTGELLALLRAGIPGGPQLLTFSTIFPRLLQAAQIRRLPIPQQRNTGTVDQLAIARNPAWSTVPGGDEAPTPAHEPPHPPAPPPPTGAEFAQRRLLSPILGTVLSLLVNLLWSALWWAAFTSDTATTTWRVVAAAAGTGGALFLLATIPLGWRHDLRNRVRLVIDHRGISKYQGKRPPAHFPWSQVDRVEIRRRRGTFDTYLVVTPVTGSTLPQADGFTRMWSNEGFLVADVDTLPGGSRAISAALQQYSAGRYRPDA